MKANTKMLAFELGVFIVLILSGFVSSILNITKMVGLLILLNVLFKIIFGFEKDRHRYVKDIIYDIIIILVIYYIIYYICGLFIGFASNSQYYSQYALINIVLPALLVIPLKEYLRYGMLTKVENSKIMIIITTILFIFLDMSTAAMNFSSYHNIFIFLALVALPAISANILCSYLVLKTGYKTSITYLLIIALCTYLIPIIPNPSEYLASVLLLMLPMVVLYRVYIFFEKERDTYTDRNYNKKHITGIVLVSIATIILVYFVSGYFRYYAVAIASNSMVETFNRGDVVIVDQKVQQTQKIKVNDILAYKHSGVIVVHRVVDIKKYKNEKIYYTRGDANRKTDNWKVEEKDVVGVVNYVIPYIGYPTVWFSKIY